MKYEITIQCDKCADYDVRVIDAKEMPKEGDEVNKINCCGKAKVAVVIYAEIANPKWHPNLKL